MHSLLQGWQAAWLRGLVFLFAAVSTLTAPADELTATELAQLEAFGPWPQATPPDAGNELSGLAWAEALGERLFNETALSGDHTRSCASCHQSDLGFTDGLPVAAGVQMHVRNTQGLLDVGQQRWFGWDGGADSLWAASLRPMLSKFEMAGRTDLIASRLRAMDSVMTALKDAGRSLDPTDTTNEALVVFAAKALGAYQRTLISPGTPFDDFRNSVQRGDATEQKEYSKAAKRGLSIFLGEANCHVCHFGPNFSNREFHDTGRPFFTGVGEVDPGRYTGIQRVRQDRFNLMGEFNGTGKADEIRKSTSVTLSQLNFGQWRTPSLRNLTLTGPYLHDGSLETLREVVDAYADIDPERLHGQGESILKPLSLSEREREDLVAFLRSLSTESLAPQGSR